MKEKLLFALTQNNIISESEIPIYLYGIQISFILIGNFILGLILSILLKTTFAYFIILALFIPLRRYSGGFHASKQVYCFIYSQLIILIGEIILSNLYIINFVALNILVIISTIIIIIKSPLASMYKPINKNQKLKYRKITITLCLVYLTIYFIFDNRIIIFAIGYILIIQSLLLLIPEQKHF